MDYTRKRAQAEKSIKPPASAGRTPRIAVHRPAEWPQRALQLAPGSDGHNSATASYPQQDKMDNFAAQLHNHTPATISTYNCHVLMPPEIQTALGGMKQQEKEWLLMF